MKHRIVFDSAEKCLETEDILVLIGPRQAGKTTVLRHLESVLKAQGRKVTYFTLEEKDYLEELNKDPKNLFRIFPFSKDSRHYFLIDEIQYLEDPTHFLKLLYDLHRKNIKLIVTGSSAFYMDRKFKDSLAGRKKILPVYPLGFRDFLTFKDRRELSEYLPVSFSMVDPKNVPLSGKKEMENLYFDYLLYGGYPKVVLMREVQEKKDELREIGLSYLKKDILEAGIKNENAYYKVIHMLADSPGALVNSSELASTVRVSQTAIDHYLWVAQKAFHFALIRPFFNNLRKELTKMPKVYFYDPGLRNYFARNFEPLMVRPDRGDLLENGVFRQLLEYFDLDQVQFWRTADGNEVDFIVDEQHAIEVKYSENAYRESKYRKFKELYPNIPLRLTSLDVETKAYPAFLL